MTPNHIDHGHSQLPPLHFETAPIPVLFHPYTPIVESQPVFATSPSPSLAQIFFVPTTLPRLHILGVYPVEHCCVVA